MAVKSVQAAPKAEKPKVPILSLQDWARIGLYLEVSDSTEGLELFQEAIRNQSNSREMYCLRNALLYLLEQELTNRGHMMDYAAVTSFYWLDGLCEKRVGCDHYIDGDFVVSGAIYLWLTRDEHFSGPVGFSKRQKNYTICAMRRVLKLLEYKPDGLEDYFWMSALAYILLRCRNRYLKNNIASAIRGWERNGLTVELGEQAARAMRKTGLTSSTELTDMLG